MGYIFQATPVWIIHVIAVDVYDIPDHMNKNFVGWLLFTGPDTKNSWALSVPMALLLA